MYTQNKLVSIHLVAALVYQHALQLSSSGTQFDLPRNGVASESGYEPINTENRSYYSSLQRSSQSYQQQGLHQNQQQHQSATINMLDLSVSFEESAPLKQGQQLEVTTYPPPTFDFGMPRNITARSGQTATINCRVEQLGDKSVSWIRKRDLHILTADISTYTSDERFQVVRTADLKDWTLQVKYAQPRDSGIYECQVNTEPKISMAFRLQVIEHTPSPCWLGFLPVASRRQRNFQNAMTPPDAKAFITGPPALYVKVGSAITLTCHVKQPLSAPDIGPIYWYRANYMLTPFVSHPNEAAIDMQRISMESKLGVKLQSRLRIANAQLSDSGNYTCMPTTAEAASVMVNVINDENPAAMQKSAASHLQSYCVILLCLVGLSLRWLSSLCSLHSPQHHQRPQQFNKIQPLLKSVDAPKFKHMKGESNSALNIYFYLLYDTWGLAKGEQIYVRTCSFHKIFRYEKR